ncbi:MAG: nucleotide exchange factor GrpE [Gammaproteobacteria bacterium]|nr:nucleotide exchange factor GrpE [Gammaproteobacteria bacterium]
MSDKPPKDWKSFKEENEHLDAEPVDAELLEDEDEEGDGGTGDVAEELEHLSYEELQAKLTETEQKMHQYWDQATRATAELENVRRRAERDVAQAHKFGLERFIDGLLPVVDSLDQALQLVDAHADQAMHEGLSLTMKLFLDVLEKFHVEQLDPIGEIFNPQEHEAMSMVEGDAPASTIITVFQKGYKLNDRVIRPARVIVAK